MSCMEGAPPPAWIWAEIQRIIRSGNTAEVKKEHGQIVVVEIKRKLIKKS